MGKIAVVFAGQGAQAPGMGRSVYEGSNAARRALDAAEAIRPGTLNQCFESPASLLNQTLNTQPCMFAVDYACAMAVRESGVEVSACAGFSLGEVAAAAFSGMLPFDKAFSMVMHRAELMQKCASEAPGGMAAVLRLSAEQVVEIASRHEGVYPVNFNCPGQTVVSFGEGCADAFSEEVKALRGRMVPLNVSGAFHSPMMAQAAAGLKALLLDMTLAPPVMPLYANLTAKPYEGDFTDTLARQVCSPVLWEQTVRQMALDGVDTFIEVGPGSTLCALIGKTLEGAKCHAVSDMEGLGRMIGGINA